MFIFVHYYHLIASSLPSFVISFLQTNAISNDFSAPCHYATILNEQDILQLLVSSNPQIQTFKSIIINL